MEKLIDKWRVGLGVWFSLRVREVPGSNPGRALFIKMSGCFKKKSTRMGFEPTRAEHIGLAVQRLNHSATSSSIYSMWNQESKKEFLMARISLFSFLIQWLVGLGVWFSLWVREVPGSNPGRAQYFFVLLLGFRTFEKKVPWPGFEPGLLRPQRKVLTTILSRQMQSRNR